VSPRTIILTPADLEATWDADGTNRLLFLHVVPSENSVRVAAVELAGDGR